MKIMKKSIKSNIIIYFSIVFSIVIIIFCASLIFLFDLQYKNNIDKTLINKAENIHSYFLNNNNTINISTDELKYLANQGIIIYVYNEENSIFSNSTFSHKTINWIEYRFYSSKIWKNYVYIWKSLYEYKNIKNIIIAVVCIIWLCFIIIFIICAFFFWNILIKPLYILIENIKKYNFKNNKKLDFNSWIKETNEIWNEFNILFEQLNKDVEEKKMFLEETSHELRTPTMAILSSIELLENIEIPSNKKQKIEIIKRNALKLNNIINNFLKFAKLDQDIFRENININNEIQNIIKHFDQQIREKNLNITIKNEWEINIKWNTIYIQSLFENLINNAIQYNKIWWSITITITTKIIIIQDTWIWISKDNLQNIWKRFFKQSTQNQWIGLWLSIVKKICDLYNINIQVNSEIEKWTTFILEINSLNEK